MSDAAPDCNLQFGILAFQKDLISREQFAAALQLWSLDKNRSLADILVSQGALSAQERCAVEALVLGSVPRGDGNARHGSPSGVAPDSEPQAPAPSTHASVPSTQASATTAHATETAAAACTQRPNLPRYRKLHSHARGGLGEVFLAEDLELHREVALKEILPHCADDEESRSRFIAEAEITGLLEHPGIVPVYGLGFDPDGRPYYAMRFIHGESLKAASERFHTADKPGRDPAERRSAFRQLLRRFVDACNAVAYAHSRGVLHRDLKPANIMLGKFGETLVVDWGLAKAGVRADPVGAAEMEPTTLPSVRPGSGSDQYATEAGVALGTPAYMSPEQAAGERDALGPATDIYGLGATLYVLLTGRRPFRGETADEVRAQVRQGLLVPPRAVKRDVSPALEAVCLKAMAFRPSDRYSSALDLAADVEHWLADEPVSAYAEPWSVRAGRWARRHRTPVVATAVLLVSAVAALATTTALVLREQRLTAEAKRRAEHNFELARDLSFHGVDLVASSEASFATIPTLQAARKELLKAAAQAFREYYEQQPNDPELQWRTAQVYRYAANVQRFANEVDSALALYRDAIQIQEGLAAQFPDRAEYRHVLAEILRDYAGVQVKTGRLREAADLLRRAVEIAEPLAAEIPQNAGYRRNLATALLDLCGVEYSLGLVFDSGKTAERAAEHFRALVELPPSEGHPYNPVLLAAALNRVAVAQRDSGKPADASPIHKEAIQILQNYADKRPERVALADILHFLARSRLENGRTLSQIPERRKDAEASLTFAVSQWEKLAKTYSTSPLYREWLGVAYQARGQYRADANRVDEARTDFERSRELLEASVEASPSLPALRGDLGRTYLALARLARTVGDTDSRAANLTKAVAALRVAVDKSPDQVVDRRSLEEVQAELAR